MSPKRECLVKFIKKRKMARKKGKRENTCTKKLDRVLTNPQGLTLLR